MSDYTICVENLPRDSEFNKDSNILRAMLWKHFQTICAMQDFEDNGQDNEPGNKRMHAKKVEDCWKYEIHDKYEVADICFGRQQIDNTTDLVELHKYYKEKRRLEARLAILEKAAEEKLREEEEEAAKN